MDTVEYQVEMGEVKYPEGFFEVIKNLSIEEQIKYFRTTYRSSFIVTNWSERTVDFTKALEDNDYVKAVIVKDGYIVGAMIKEWYSGEPSPVLIDKCVCTYYACDNNGAGYKEREDYMFLICAPLFESN